MTRISVPDMTCGHCRAKIEEALLEADEAAMLDFDMAARVVEVDSSLETPAILATIKAAGYSPTEAA